MPFIVVNIARLYMIREFDTWKKIEEISGKFRMASKQCLDARSLTRTMQHVAARTASGFDFPDLKK